jgi:predicted DNA-binding helix-hairpin-helix protein
MNIRSAPDVFTRLTRMGDVTLFEPAGDQPQAERKPRSARPSGDQSHSLEECISSVATPQGAKPILKSMLTTACERNCFYCPFRAGRAATERITITPDEMAKALDGLAAARKVDGLFLSSGIIRGSITTQDKLIDTVEIIRRRYHYRGYIHLKIMPGAEKDQLYRAMQLADRVSVNLEAPTQARLEQLAPKKDFTRELLAMLTLAADLRREHPHERLARTVTQFVVGAAGDTDLELLALTQRLHQQAGLVRAYFSAFSPVIHTPLENTPPTDPQREFRLYQSSFLLRDYGFDVEDLPFSPEGVLPTDRDPKLVWAEANLAHHPVDVMTAERRELLRVPGIGPASADAILSARRRGRLGDVSDLRRLGIRAPERAAPFILFGGRRPPVQAALW